MFTKKLKKTVSTVLPIIAFGGVISAATMVQVVWANNEVAPAIQTDPSQEITIDPSQDISVKQREAWMSQLLAQGKTQEEAEAMIAEMLK